MPAGTHGSRTQVWLESLGDWSWPGRAGAATENLPPSWVPVVPPRLEAAAAAPAAPVAWPRERGLPRARALLVGIAAAICATVALNGPLGLERAVGLGASSEASLPQTRLPDTPAPPLATLTEVSRDGAGSSIDAASYASPALHGGHGSFLVYLPRGYASTTARYPVLYLLHGNDQPDSAFLQVGLQGALDGLIARHAIPSLIAVMIQGGPGPNNWRNSAAGHYESYVLEVQQLVDRILPTVATRSARAIAGDSMGGYGAMNIALSNPYRYSVVESWIGFFDGLQDQLRADRPILARVGLRAFVYGAESDRIANPGEDPSFAASLRAAGARAKSAIYPGEHSLQTVEAHLQSMLLFAGHALAQQLSAPPPAALQTRAGAGAPGDAPRHAHRA